MGGGIQGRPAGSVAGRKGKLKGAGKAPKAKAKRSKK